MSAFSLSGVYAVDMVGGGREKSVLCTRRVGHRIHRLMRTRDTLSHCDMSEMITLSPTDRPCTTSMAFTDARPSFTLTRVASLPSGLTLKRPTVLSAEPYAGRPT